jgi:hypothetical protein
MSTLEESAWKVSGNSLFLQLFCESEKISNYKEIKRGAHMHKNRN